MARFLFGPVNSRRLGRSLGVDLLPFKTCSLDCIYCECGFTTDHTTTRREFVPTDAVIAELDAYLAEAPPPDHVTFSGAGEPTLHAGIGRVIAHLKQRHSRCRVAVLTNGTLLGDPAVRADLALADLVVPSLDGASEAAFGAICRPARGLTVEAVIAGIAAFRRDFAGLLLLEIFIVPGLNDTPAELAALKVAAGRIGPDAIQLNHLDRPAPHPGVAPVSPAALRAIRDSFRPLPVQPVRERGAAEAPPWSDPALQQEILALLQRGPADLHRLSALSGLRTGDLAKILARMTDQGLVRAESGGLFRPVPRVRRPSTPP
ncbi:Radical SAM protein [Rhodovastum atsumiense]|uniref:Radical SAM protein n=1 Tax=Rhodovastum atsumiense TaxID=504468 RepID=A0A5M6IWU6_9PROT|nr:radical SAM protein [Rhodovastum atsumiense]KAA5612711.1 radical SAM protein [Rhodovastum atsumiense]CAH2602736.1 Radical SAM protein [Rhodovastum atsumiense]